MHIACISICAAILLPVSYKLRWHWNQQEYTEWRRKGYWRWWLHGNNTAAVHHDCAINLSLLHDCCAVVMTDCTPGDQATSKRSPDNVVTSGRSPDNVATSRWFPIDQSTSRHSPSVIVAQLLCCVGCHLTLCCYLGNLWMDGVDLLTVLTKWYNPRLSCWQGWCWGTATSLC